MTVFCFWNAAIFTHMPSQHHYLGYHHLTFIWDKLERVAEDSEAWDSFLRAIIHKLVSQPVATLATKDLRLLYALLSPSCLTCFIFIFLKSIVTLIHWLETYLEGSQSLHHLGDAVLSDGFCESRPRRRVGKLGAAGEQRVVTLGAHVYTCRRQLVFRLKHWIVKTNKQPYQIM